MVTGEALLGLLLTATLLGQLIQINLFGLDIAPLDFAVGISVIWGGISLVRKGTLREVMNLPMLKPGIWFAAIILFSWILAIPALTSSLSALLVSLLYAIRLIAYLLLPIVLVGLLKPSRHLLHQKMLIGSGCILACFGLLQLAILPDFQIYDHLGWDPHRHRLIGSFLDPNYTAIWLAIMLGLSGALFLSYWKNLKTTALNYLGTGGLFLMAAGLTLSRSGLLAIAAVLLAAALLHFRKWALPLLVVGALVIAAVPALNQRVSSAISLDTTVRYRLESWEGGATIIRQHPIFGVGYNTLKFRRYDDALPGTSKLVSRFEDGIIRAQQLTSRADGGFDSSLLTILATTGIVGLLAFLWWVWQIITTALRVRHRQSFIWNSWVITATAALLLSSWFVNAWLYSPILLLWLIAVSMAQLEQNQHDV